MTIKEVERILELPRASIRYYEQQGLISPERNDNDYRDYSERDVERLKKILVLRKVGISISEISDLLDGEVSLTEILKSNIENLVSQIDDLNGSLDLCREMLSKEAEFATFDAEHYLNEIKNRETKGSRFFDIAKDIIESQKEGFIEHWGYEKVPSAQNPEIKEKRGNPTKAILVFLFNVIIWIGVYSRSYGEYGMIIAAAVLVFMAIMPGIEKYIKKSIERKYCGNEEKIRKANDRLTIAKVIAALTLGAVLFVILIKFGSLSDKSHTYDISKSRTYGYIAIILMLAILIVEGIFKLLGKIEPERMGYFMLAFGIVLSASYFMFFRPDGSFFALAIGVSLIFNGFANIYMLKKKKDK